MLMVYRGVVKFIPETKGFGVKRWLLRLAGAEIGKNVRICSSAFIGGAGKLTVGDDTWIGHQDMIISSSSVTIGVRVDVAPRVVITTGTHEISYYADRIAGSGVSQNVSVGDGSWICAGAIILPGVTVGEMSLVAAGAVVNRDVKPRTLVGGVPAKLIKDFNLSEYTPH